MQSQYQVLRRIANSLGITIKRANKHDSNKQGIHRLYPNLNDLHDAIDVAERDGFKTIYIHSLNTWPSKN